MFIIEESDYDYHQVICAISTDLDENKVLADMIQMALDFNADMQLYIDTYQALLKEKGYSDGCEKMTGLSYMVRPKIPVGTNALVNPEPFEQRKEIDKWNKNLSDLHQKMCDDIRDSCLLEMEPFGVEIKNKHKFMSKYFHKTGSRAPVDLYLTEVDFYK